MASNIQHTKDFKVAIIGGGMGGLSLAVGLLRRGLKVDIFEQAPKFEEIGAGVGLGPNGLQALRGFGILDAVLEKADEPLSMRTFIFLSGYPGHEVIYDYPGLDSDISLSVHRAHFLDALVQLLPPDVAHFNKKCTEVSQLGPEGAIVTFEDGTTHHADLVIGCDGIKSVVRGFVVGKSAEPKFTRTVAYRGMISEELAVAAIDERIRHRSLAFCGTDRHLIVFPIKGKHLVNIVVFVTDRSRPAEEQGPLPGQPWVVPSTQEEMLSHFEGWGPKVLDLLAHIKTPSKWFLHSQNPTLDTYIRGHIGLLGDAAHSTLPHQGAGAGQAVEDAYLLTQLLSHPSTRKKDLQSVLEAYDIVRRPRANSVVTGSYMAGEIYEFAGPSGGSAEGIRKDLTGMWDYLWHHDLEDDYSAAVKILEDKEIFTTQNDS